MRRSTFCHWCKGWERPVETLLLVTPAGYGYQPRVNWQARICDRCRDKIMPADDTTYEEIVGRTEVEP